MYKKILFVTILMSVFSLLNAQNRGGGRGQMNPAMMAADITIIGHVYNKSNNKPVEYANIILFKMKDSTQVNGNVTDVNGTFQITKVRPGRYFMDVQFMGFAKKRINNLKIRPDKKLVEIGEIFLEQNILDMDKVEVEADRVTVSFQIDKKVVNVGRDAVSASGTAVDVLENVPSVSVDIEGNVSLRGSENFTVLIDGRPTILEPNDILQQLPASKIENIEIITNPSAKFDPDGVAGILNVIMKKSKFEGISGIINTNIGLHNKYGADGLISYRNHKYSAFLSLDYNHREFTGERKFDRRTTNLSGNTFYTNSIGDVKMNMEPYSIRTGFDLFLTPKDVLSVAGTFGNQTRERKFLQETQDSSSFTNVSNKYNSIDISKRGGNYYSFNIDYQHKFNETGHELLGMITMNNSDGDEEAVNLQMNSEGTIENSQKSTESGPSNDFRIKFDYTLPINETNKFESGIQSRIGRSDEDNKVYYYNDITEDYDFKNDYSHSTIYKNNIHALYSMYSFQTEKLGFKGGLRGEYTDRLIELAKEDVKFAIDRFDIFPTAHLSWQQTEKTQFMGSYARRIQRARGYWLEPFITWGDAYNVRMGNPGIKPQYIDSYELSFMQYLGKNMLSVEAFRKINNNKVERVQTVYEEAEDVVLHTVANVGKDYTTGTEFMFRLNSLKWLSLSCMGSLYEYKIKGEFNDIKFDNESINWSLKFNSEVKFKTNTQVQINSNYHSPTVTSLGERKGHFSINLAIKQQFMKRALSATLQVRDIFGTAKHDFTTETDRLYSHYRMQRESPIIMLNLRYNFNNYRETKKKSRDDNGYNDEDNDF